MQLKDLVIKPLNGDEISLEDIQNYTDRIVRCMLVPTELLKEED